MTPEPEIAALYAGPPEAFVAQRDALAKRLAGEGRDAEAAAVKALRKPNLAAWAVNRLAHVHGEDLRALAEVWDRLAEAPDARAVGELAAERKGLIGHLLDLAEDELEAIGRGSAAILDKVGRTLNSGVSGEERERLLEGRLERELEPAGFSAWTGAGLPDPEVSVAQRELERAEAGVADKRDDLDRAERALSQAEEARERAEAAAKAARERAARARADHDDAVARLEELRERLSP